MNFYGYSDNRSDTGPGEGRACLNQARVERFLFLLSLPGAWTACTLWKRSRALSCCWKRPLESRPVLSVEMKEVCGEVDGGAVQDVKMR